MTTATVEVVVVTCNSARYVERCLESLLPEASGVTVVDNGSSDATLSILRARYPQVQVVENGHNLGYGKACNIGFSYTHSEYVVISNADVVYSPGTIDSLVSFLKSHPQVGVTAPQFVFPDGSWQLSYADTPGVWTGIKDAIGVNSACRFVHRLLWPWSLDRRPKDVGYVAGAVLVFPRQAFLSMGGFDEAFYFYADESDLCIRLKRAGWKIIFYPLAQVMHVGGGDSVKVDRSDKFLRFMVNSQAMLARKHLSPRRARFYMWCEKICYARLALTYRILGFLLRRPYAFTSADKAGHLATLSTIWNEYSRNASAPR